MVFLEGIGFLRVNVFGSGHFLIDCSQYTSHIVVLSFSDGLIAFDEKI